MDELPDDPKLTYAVVILGDMLDKQRENPHPDFVDIVTHKESVIKRYQPIFQPDKIKNITKAQFESFLLFKNNHHWTNLNRVGGYMTEDMCLLREALAILVDERLPVSERINQVRPERYWGEHSMVSHLGTPVLTAILMTLHPDKYGVWNNTSDNGMRKVLLWDYHWERMPAGDSYVEMNKKFLDLSHYLKIDLWTLDALWWMFKK